MPTVTNDVHRLLQKRGVQKFVCCGSYAVGLLCVVLSSSFKDLHEKWILWKIFYVFFYLCLILFVLWSTLSSNDSIFPDTEVGRIILVLVLVITSVYTYFMDEIVEVKQDAYILFSYSAFAIMSLFLSTLSHCGFEDELLYFFTCTLIIQLMKIKWWLFPVGGMFMYFLVRLGSTLKPNAEIEAQLELVPQTELVPLTDSSQDQNAGPSNEDDNRVNVSLAFSVCIEALKKENDRVVDQLRADANLVDQNLVADSLQLKDLNESAQLMIEEGSEDKYLQEYTSWRREFLNIVLRKFKLSPDVEMEDIQGLVETLAVAVRILFPNEMTLCRRVFGIHDLSYSAFVEVCRELANQLIANSYAVAIRSHFIPNTLQQLLQELGTMFRLIPSEFSLRITDQVRIILDIFEKLNSDLTRDYSANVIDANGIHSITRQVMKYIGDEFNKGDDSFLGRYAAVEATIKMLENRLEATSKSYKTYLGCVFIMINRKFIASEIERLGLKPIIGDDWLKRNQDKIEQNLQLYLSSSWDETLNFVNVDFRQFIGSEDDDREFVEDNLSSFKQHLERICNDKSMWFILDDNLRVQIIESIKKKLLPAYKKFMVIYQDLFHLDYVNIVDPALHDVEGRLNNLFLESAGESDDAPKEEKKNV